MTTTLTALLVTLLAVGAQTDTTLKVQPGARLNLNNFGGQIAVEAWAKNVLRIEAAHSERLKVLVEDLGSDIEVRSIWRGRPGRVDYKIQAPEWMPLTLSGVYTDVSVQGSKSEVSAQTVQGDVVLLGGQGFVRLGSVQGSVCVGGARGRLELSSVNQGVSVRDVEGDLSVDVVNGGVTLEKIRSKLVEVATVNGDVLFVGELRDDGRYRFSSHNGDLVIGVPEDASARFSIATFRGEFESGFPVNLGRARRGKRFDFAIGSGSAQVELETFQGTISLQRSATLRVLEKAKAMAKEKEKDHQHREGFCPQEEEE
jgi:hypothetical protein